MDLNFYESCHQRTYGFSFLTFSDNLLKVHHSGADPGFRRGGRTFRRGGGGSYRNFRSGSKLLQGPGQINKQKKLQTAVGGGGDHPPPPPKKKPVSAPAISQSD